MLPFCHFTLERTRKRRNLERWSWIQHWNWEEPFLAEKLGKGSLRVEIKSMLSFGFSPSIKTWDKSMVPTFFTGTLFLSSKRCLAGVELFVVASLYAWEVFFSLRLVSSFWCVLERYEINSDKNNHIKYLKCQLSWWRVKNWNTHACWQIKFKILFLNRGCFIW